MLEQHLFDDSPVWSSLQALDQEHYLPVFKRFPVAFAMGKGCELYDTDGKKYLDALAGIAVCNLGHAHPAINEVIRRQAEELLHVSNFFITKPQAMLAQQLTVAAQMDQVFFCNSGTEAFEGAVKLARKYSSAMGRGKTIVSMKEAFHGRTMAAMAAMAAGKPEMQKDFGPIPEGFIQIPFNDAEAFKKIASPEIGAVVIEPIQGEGGINVARKEYLMEVKALCDQHNILLIFDEIQCGMGRTGALFAKDLYGVQPDIMLLAKALGNGIPIGAIVCHKKVSQTIKPGDHGTTFGGNPLACAVALTVLREMLKPGFLEQVKQKGSQLKSKLLKLKDNHDSITDVRGEGLMLGVAMDGDAKDLVTKLLKKGVVANATANNVLRLVPPLIISEEEIHTLVQAIHECL